MDNAGGASDPFATRITPNCKPTSSQEEKLQSCHFAGELQVCPEDPQSSSATDESSEQATGIIMVSLPDSFDEYQTPPEQHFYSQNSSNDGQVHPAKTEGVDRKIEGGGASEGEAMVVGDESEQEAQRTVDLTKDSDNPGFSEKSPRVLVEEDDTVMADVDTDQIGIEIGVSEVVAEIGVTEVLEAELPNSQAENTPKVFVEMPLKEQDESISSGKSKTPRKNVDDIDKFRYVNTGKKRELPFSMKGQEEGSAGEDDYSKHRVLVGMLDQALKVLGGQVTGDGGNGEGGDEDEGDFDFLETAKSRGLTFPRPRWWPPEGFED